MASQCELILAHLRLHGTITHMEAEELYGCTRLAARIADLNSKGNTIVTIMVRGKNRYGKVTRYARYQLVGGGGCG